MTTCHYTFEQTHRVYTANSEPLYKLWTLGNYGGKYWFMNSNKCTNLMGYVSNRGAGSIWGLCTFLSILL